jgi:hypothetical protein
MTPFESYKKAIEETRTGEELDAVSANIKAALAGGFLSAAELPELVAAGKERRAVLATAAEVLRKIQQPLPPPPAEEEPEPFFNPDPELAGAFLAELQAAPDRLALKQIRERYETAARQGCLSRKQVLALFYAEMAQLKKLCLPDPDTKPSEEAQALIAKVEACPDWETYNALVMEALAREWGGFDTGAIDTAFEIKFRDLDRVNRKGKKKARGEGGHAVG